MNQIEVKNKAIEFLESKSKEIRSKLYSISAKEVADTIGGYPPTVGNVAEDIVKELQLRGINITYDKVGSPKRFIIG